MKQSVFIPPAYMQEAIAAAARVQEQFASLVPTIGGYAQVLGLDRVLAQTSVLASRMTADLTALRALDIGGLSRALRNVPRASADVVQAFDRYAASSLPDVRQ